MAEVEIHRLYPGTGNAFKVPRVKGDGTEFELVDLGGGVGGSYIPTSEKGAANGVAPLDAGSKISSIYLPAIAITTPFVVGSQAAMLALTAQEGDVAIRTDIQKNYILKNGGNPTVLADWLELQGGAGTVSSVNGYTGVVVIGPTDITGLTEYIQDALNDVLVMGTGLSKTYNDPSNTLTLNATTSGITFTGSYAGALSVSSGALRLYNDTGSTLTIAAMRFQLGTAPTGSSAIFDVHKNGTTLFTTQANRPSIAANANLSSKITNMNVTSFEDGSYLTIDIDQVGSTTPGSDLQVQIQVN